jgi:uncharacterized protein with FMN-binding domain
MGVSRRAVVTLSVTAGALLLLANFHTSSGSSNLTIGNAAGAAATTATTDVTGTASVASPTTAGAPPPPTTPPSTAPPSTAPPSTAAASTGASTAPPPPRTVAPTSAPPVATSVKAKAVDGPTIGTPYGDVQVRVVLRGSRIVDVQPLTLPSDRSRSRRISEQAAPLLRTEALQAQSANIDLLSGASYTSEGYAESLQGALDAARS